VANDILGLAGKVFMVTGASSGMGAETARSLGRCGARVALVARRKELLSEVAANVRAAGGQALELVLDVNDEAQLREAVALTRRQFGRLDGAFNNAGVLGRGAPLHELTTADYEDVMGVNVRSLFWSMKYQVEALLQDGGGAIVNNASIVAQVGFAGASLYTASKHAVLGLTRSAALEYFRQGIRINAVLPGPIETPMAVEGFGGVENLHAALQALPPGRPGQVGEVAHPVLFLLSDAASYISGQGLAVDGGYTAA
jgi:NAD(P)-dependent dehydrogenase (short-subunit alcohol dehydrogenase family)